MGDQTTTRLPDAVEESEVCEASDVESEDLEARVVSSEAVAEVAETRSAGAESGPHGTGRVVSRVFGWLFFVGGLVGAVLGIAGLHVEITVAGLILACTAGLVLLKLRAGGPDPASAG
ncbi:hypothetical protein [Nocardia paucivorans]|uniref:hypothetical protein n=1 Tax=Nocardia paucivorans TaxID=114259 RepID=UPI0012FB0423|nr:hypothetical protein [Nocardia paucivorans]